MPVPMDEVRHVGERARPLRSKPHEQSVMIVLVGRLEQVAESTSVSGLSRVLAQAPGARRQVSTVAEGLSNEDAAGCQSATRAPANDAALLDEAVPRNPW